MEHIDQPASRGFIFAYASNGDPVIERRQQCRRDWPAGRDPINGLAHRQRVDVDPGLPERSRVFLVRLRG